MQNEQPRPILSKEAEKALKRIAKIQRADGSGEMVESSVSDDCLRYLIRRGLVSTEWFDELAEDYGQPPDRYLLTLSGRNYFSNKHRAWLWSNSNAIVGAVSGIVGSVAGYIISSLT